MLMGRFLHNQIQLNGGYADKYLIYNRKSTDDADNQKNSISFQSAENIKFAAQLGLPIAALSIEGFCKDGIINEHHSGFKEDNSFELLPGGKVLQKIQRPKFMTLIDLLRNKEVKGLICLCWDRISRNESDDLLLSKLLKQGVDIKFVRADYADSSSGKLHMDVDKMFARHYSRVISEKVLDAGRKLRAENRCLYRSPVGYLDNGSDSKPLDPEKAPIVKRLFELYAEGGWSFETLAQWANDHGLTTKPARRPRTKREKAMGVSLESIPKTSRPFTRKTIEYLLKNAFYIGKRKEKGEWKDSIAHQPLIDTALFYKVQEVMKGKTTVVHYPQKSFFTYRGMIKCTGCHHLYSPYVQKGINYYRSRCKKGCTNTSKNISEERIDKLVDAFLHRIYLTEEELERIECHAHKELNKVTEHRNRALQDLNQRLTKAMADLDYLTRERITLLRKEIMDMKSIKEEEARIQAEIEDIKLHIHANSESTRAMLDYIISFSELIKNLVCYFETALDSEKQKIITELFAELYLEDGKLKFVAKQGVKRLLMRLDAPSAMSGSPHFPFSELESIYRELKASNINGHR